MSTQDESNDVTGTTPAEVEGQARPTIVQQASGDTITATRTGEGRWKEVRTGHLGFERSRVVEVGRNLGWVKTYEGDLRDTRVVTVRDLAIMVFELEQAGGKLPPVQNAQPASPSISTAQRILEAQKSLILERQKWSALLREAGEGERSYKQLNQGIENALEFNRTLLHREGRGEDGIEPISSLGSPGVPLLWKASWQVQGKRPTPVKKPLQ